MNKCYGCMEDVSPEKNICPKCGCSDDVTAEKEHHLSPGTIIRGEYLVGLAIEEKEDCIVYIGHDFSKSEKVLIKEFFPTEYLFRTANDDVAEIKEGCVEDYEEHLGNFLKEHKELASGDEDSKSGVYKCFLENNTCYVIEKHNGKKATPKSAPGNPRKSTAYKKRGGRSRKKDIRRSSIGKGKVAGLVAGLFCVLILAVVIIAISISNAGKRLSSNIEHIYASTDGENFFELEFSREKDFSKLDRSSFSANLLDKDIIGDARELFVKTDSEKNCTISVYSGSVEVASGEGVTYVVPLDDSGEITIVSQNEKGIGSVKPSSVYTFSYKRKVYTKLTGLGYILNDNGKQLSIPDFNPDVHDYVINLTNKTSLIHINSVMTDADTQSEVIFVGSENYDENKDANKTGKLKITPAEKAHEIYVEVKLKDKNGEKEDSTYHLTLKVPAKEKPVAKPKSGNSTKSKSGTYRGGSYGGTPSGGTSKPPLHLT